MALKDDDGVGVLFCLAQGTLIRRFKPGVNALGMKHVFAGEAFLGASGDVFKTYGTRLGKMRVALSVVGREILALLSLGRH